MLAANADHFDYGRGGGNAQDGSGLRRLPVPEGPAVEGVGDNAEATDRARKNWWIVDCVEREFQQTGDAFS